MANKARPARHARREAQLAARKPPTARPAPDAWVVTALGVAFLVSGSAGLMHEVVWSRLLGHVFGATSLAISTVLAAFMGGLAAGSWWIGRRSAGLADPRRTYALLEVGVGIAALLVPLLLAAVEPLYGWLWRRFEFSFAVFSVLRFVVATGILIGPTMMMGATLPVLADHLAALKGRRLAPQWLYTVNLIGAVIGVAAAGFVLMPAIGVWGTILTGAALNVGVGLGVLALPALAERPRAADEPAVKAAPLDRLLLVAAFVSGLTSLATQVAWTRVLILVVGSTTYAFSSVLLVYLVALGAGSAWASRRARAGTSTDLAVMHGLMAFFLVATLYAVNRLPYWYLKVYYAWEPASLAGVVGVSLTLVFAVVVWPVLCAGTILPLVLVAAVPDGGRGTGPVVGRIYAVNTIGAIAGAVLGGFVVIPRYGSQATLVGVALLATALACLFAWRRGHASWLPGFAVATAVAVGIGVVARPEWNFMELHVGVFEPGRIYVKDPDTLTNEGDRVLYAREGPTATVMVAELGKLHRLVINARVNASDAKPDMMTQILLGQVPLLVAPRTDDVFVVGWGSGVTVGSILASDVKRVTATELEPAVVESSRFFEHVNHRPLLDPRLRLYTDDARHILLASEESYDIVVSEPPHPWVSGVANIFTQDFYRVAARRLRPDGVFTQWLQTYEMSYDTFRAILAAFQSVFPEVMVFQLGESLDTIVVGSRQPFNPDLAELDRRWNLAGSHEELARIGLQGPEALVARFFLGPDAVRTIVAGAPINTDDDMYVEFRGPRDMAIQQEDSEGRTFQALARHATPVEQLLRDPAPLMTNPTRRQALADALHELQ